MNEQPNISPSLIERQRLIVCQQHLFEEKQMIIDINGYTYRCVDCIEADFHDSCDILLDFISPMRISEIAFRRGRSPESVEEALINIQWLPDGMISLALGDLGAPLRRDGTLWDSTEDARLIAGYEKGFTVFELSLRHLRNVLNIRDRLMNLNRYEFDQDTLGYDEARARLRRSLAGWRKESRPLYWKEDPDPDFLE